jgi:hypothetical protein
MIEGKTFGYDIQIGGVVSVNGVDISVPLKLDTHKAQFEGRFVFEVDMGTLLDRIRDVQKRTPPPLTFGDLPALAREACFRRKRYGDADA